MSKAKDTVKKVVLRSLNKPFKVGEEERDFLVEEMIEAMEQVNKIEAEISPMKDSMKSHQKAADEARDKLVKGKPYNVEVEETFDFEKGEIYCKIIDTGEKLPTRKMVDEDYQTDITDGLTNSDCIED